MQPGHAWLTQHYKWGLDRLFFQGGHSHAIIVEDDMLFSPDFLGLFEATAPLLDSDPSLWCISSWNDNGLKFFDWGATRLVPPHPARRMRAAVPAASGQGEVPSGACAEGPLLPPPLHAGMHALTSAKELLPFRYAHAPADAAHRLASVA